MTLKEHLDATLERLKTNLLKDGHDPYGILVLVLTDDDGFEMSAGAHCIRCLYEKVGPELAKAAREMSHRNDPEIN